MPASELSWHVKLRDYWVNDGGKLIFMFIFLAVNIAVFVQSFMRMFIFLTFNSTLLFSPVLFFILI